MMKKVFFETMKMMQILIKVQDDDDDGFSSRFERRGLLKSDFL